MSSLVLPGTASLADTSLAAVAAALRRSGLWFDLGAATIRVQGSSSALPSQLQRVYGAYPFVERSDWADLHVRIDRSRGVRGWMRPQVVFRCDGQLGFDPFPADSPLPMFEWGCNWLIGRRLNDLLLLHAGAVERDGLALVMPAMPGSGKSTLTAALASSGWRLLSDEFGAIDTQSLQFRALLKPVGLKNASIDVIRQFAPAAVLGPSFLKTRKGTVAHLAPTADAVARRSETARPGAIVLPLWKADSDTRFEPVSADQAFSALAFNAFNYQLLGIDGYRAAVHLVEHCPAWQLVYSRLDEAIAVINDAWPSVCGRQQA